MVRSTYHPRTIVVRKRIAMASADAYNIRPNNKPTIYGAAPSSLDRADEMIRQYHKPIIEASSDKIVNHAKTVWGMFTSKGKVTRAEFNNARSMESGYWQALAESVAACCSL